MVEYIKINKDEDYIVEENKIEKKEDKLHVYYISSGGNRNHILIENVEEFDVVEKKNLFYIKLKVKNQEERIYCYEKA